MSGLASRPLAFDGSWGPPQRLAGMHLLCGAGWLEASRRLWRDHPGAPAHRRRLFARVLGARHMGEGVALLCSPSPRCMRLAAATDALHGASMMALAAFDPRWRRPALLSAATASALSAYATRFGVRA